MIESAYGYRLVEVGRPLVYDPTKRLIVGDPAANTLLRRSYRTPWVRPEVV